MLSVQHAVQEMGVGPPGAAVQVEASNHPLLLRLTRVRRFEILWIHKSLCTTHLTLCALPVCHYRIFSVGVDFSRAACESGHGAVPVERRRPGLVRRLPSPGGSPGGTRCAPRRR